MERTGFSEAALRGNVAAVYAETASTHPDRLAVAAADRRLTHDGLRTRGLRFAGGLGDLGLTPADRLGLLLPNGAAFVVALLGGFAAGTPPVPLNTELRPPEVATLLTDSGAAALVADRSLVEGVVDAFDHLEAPPPVVLVDGDGTDETAGDATSRGDGEDDSVASAGGDETALDRLRRVTHVVDFDTVVAGGDETLVDREDDDVALHPYTSGTTGEPKGVLLTHRNLRAQSLLGFDRTAIPPERERFLSPLPLAHIAGLVNRTWQPLVRGGSVHLVRASRWDPERALETIERESITKFGAVATMYVDLVEHDAFDDYDLSSLEEAMQGGTKLPEPVARRFEAATGIRPFEAYGLTETGGGTHVGHGSTFGHRVGTIGQPLRATDCKVVDEDGEEVPTGEPGELLVRGPHVMAGYHERPGATEAAFTDAGYVRTGDVVRRDADNYFEMLDRKDDVVVTNGYNVYPAEVEDALLAHESVGDAAVVGLDDDRRNERVTAYVVPADGMQPDAAAIRTSLEGRLARYKRPHEIRFVETLPRTASGKVRKTDLGAAQRTD